MVTYDDVVMDVKVMRHHADEHCLPRSRLDVNDTAIDASHRRHDVISSRPIIEVIQDEGQQKVARTRRYSGRSGPPKHVRSVGA